MATFEQRILDALPFIVCLTDLDGRLTGINRSRSRLTAEPGPLDLGSVPDPQGMPIHEVLPAAVSREQLDHAMTALRTGRAQELAWTVAHDEDRAHRIHVTPLLDRSTVSGFCITIADTSAAHRADIAVEESAVALARTVSLDRVFQEVAQQVRRLVGADSVAIAVATDETAALQLVHHSGYMDEPAAIAERLRGAWMDALAKDTTVVTTSPAGAEVSLPIPGAEGVLGTLTAALDEGAPPSPQDRVAAERMLTAIARQAGAAIERAWLIRASEHKRRLDATGEVAAGVAHELRNPLFGISSAAQLLRFRAKDDPVIEKNIGRILREVERMNRLSTSLLEYGRPQPLRLTPGDPDAIWDRVLEEEQGRLESGAIVLARTRAQPPARCAIDAEQLAQVFVQILVNALEAAPEATDISLASEVLPTGAWRCWLRNGGPPIPPDSLARAFEIFHSTKPGAAGLGLPIAQRIVEEHGGSIVLESEADTGTTVSIVLPPAA